MGAVIVQEAGAGWREMLRKEGVDIAFGVMPRKGVFELTCGVGAQAVIMDEMSTNMMAIWIEVLVI